MSQSKTGDETGVGSVSLIGAGPGHPGLLTCLGLERLRKCQVLIYDRLVPHALLHEVPDDCEKIYVGKKPGGSRTEQGEINRLLIRKAREGFTVVRLKGGDPTIFARSGEEITALVEAGIPTEIIPGVTSGIAAAAAVGIPLTHRGLASAVSFITGSETPEKKGTRIDWRSLPRSGTLVFYMIGGRIRSIVTRLIRSGLSPDTPAALVCEASLPGERTTLSNLGDLEHSGEAFKAGYPAVLIVGDVVGLPKCGIPNEKPLRNQTFILTHPRTASDELYDKLIAAGACVLWCPSIEIVPPKDLQPLEEAVARINRYDWVLLTSKNAVRALADILQQMNRDGRCLGSCRIAVVGEATGAELWDRLRLIPELVPEKNFSAEGLARALIDRGEVENRRFLFPCSEIARHTLEKTLSEAGGTVDRVIAYRTVTYRKDWTDLPLLRPDQVSGIVFASSSAVRGFVEKLGGKTFSEICSRVYCFSIGAKTSATLRDAGAARIVQAEKSDFEGLWDAILEVFTRPTLKEMPPDDPPKEREDPPR